MNYPLLYLEHLSRRDIELLAVIAGVDSAGLRRLVLDQPGAIDDLLASPELFEAVFEPHQESLDPGASTFLAFGALVNRSAGDLLATNHVAEWSGPGKRLPVFDVEPMRGFLDDGLRRYFLIEFLNSFTSVASGSYLVKTRAGYRRRRFSELDLSRMAEIVDLLPPMERPGGYRRLGDIALFLNGVFPDHAATHPLPPTERELLARSAAIKAVDAAIEDGGLRFLDTAGAGWYRRAADESEQAAGNGSGFLRMLSDHFGEARRILNYMADRYLFGHRLGRLQRPG
ncbi:MAG: hypothetical protein ACRDZM_14255 [Acidimicrobiia bacterium]